MKTIITKDECYSLSHNIENRLVVINESRFRDEFKRAKYQLVLAVSGFGCKEDCYSTGVFVKECFSSNNNNSPSTYKIHRCDLIGEPTEQLITQWKDLYGEFNDEVKCILESKNEVKE